MDGGAWKAEVQAVARSQTRLSDFTFNFHFHALEKEMATHSSVLAWRIPGTGEPGGLPSLGSHRVGHDCSDLAAAAAASQDQLGRNASLKTPFAGEIMREEVPLHRRQFSNSCQNSKRVYPLTEQFHFWKCSLDMGLHVLRATDLKAKQSYMFKKKKCMAQQSRKTRKNPEIVPFACQIHRPPFTLLRASGSCRVTKTMVPSPSDFRSSSVVQSLDREGRKRKKWRYFPPIRVT